MTEINPLESGDPTDHQDISETSTIFSRWKSTEKNRLWMPLFFAAPNLRKLEKVLEL